MSCLNNHFFVGAYYKLAVKVPYTIKSRGWKYTIKKIIFRGRDAVYVAKETAMIAIQADTDDLWKKLENQNHQ